MPIDTAPRTIPALLARNARAHPDAEAVVDSEQRLSYAQLAASAEDCARSLIAHGMEEGDRVAMLAPNSAAWVTAALGVHCAGGLVVPLNTRLTPAEIGPVLRSAGSGSRSPSRTSWGAASRISCGRRTCPICRRS